MAEAWGQGNGGGVARGMHGNEGRKIGGRKIFLCVFESWREHLFSRAVEWWSGGVVEWWSGGVVGALFTLERVGWEGGSVGTLKREQRAG
jgi:hypothetical protein